MAGTLAVRPAAMLLVVCCLVGANGLRRQSLQNDGDTELAEEEKPEILVVVNVHELPEVAAKQCEHINLRLQRFFRPHVALSCNKFMYENLSHAVLPENVYLNPEVIEKERFTGTLFQGIISNLRLLAGKHSFKYALILSSKSKIVRELTEDDIINSISTCSQYVHKNCSQICHMSTCESRMPWNAGRWNSFRRTKLAQEVVGTGSWASEISEEEPMDAGSWASNVPALPSPSLSPAGWEFKANVTPASEVFAGTWAVLGPAPQPSAMLLGGIHEGLVLDEKTARDILRFLSGHPAIEKDLYGWNEAVEEFALHTLAIHLGGSFGIMGHGGHRPKDFYKIEKVDRTVDVFSEPSPENDVHKHHHHKHKIEDDHHHVPSVHIPKEVKELMRR